MECHNQSELLDCILREYGGKLLDSGNRFSNVDLWKSCLTKNQFDLSLLLDGETQSMIERYNYCTKFPTQPFDGGYDSQPAIWVDFINILTNELSKMSEK